VDLHLSKELWEFVDEQVAAGRFKDAGAYIEALISRAKQGSQKREALLVEGLESGESMPLDADEWNRIRAEVAQRLSNVT
jgi:putative addiction module CopG family antidote